jgi:hypothetical protein
VRALPLGKLRLCHRELPLVALGVRAHLGDLPLDPAAVLAHVRHLLLEPRRLGIGLVEGALRGMRRVGSAVVLRAHLFEPLLGRAQRRGLRFQLEAELLDVTDVPFPVGGRLPHPQQPQQVLRGAHLPLQIVVAGRDLRLSPQVLELLAELGADVVHSQQVLPRVLDPHFCFVAARAVLRDAGRFLEEDAQVLGLRLDDPRDHALLDDGVGAAAEAGAEEDVGDIPAPHVDVVDVIRGELGVAREHALHRDLRVARPLPPGAAEAVIEDQLDARAVDRLALARAAEKNVLHGVPAQVLRGGLAQHPAGMWVGSTKDLKPARLICLSRNGAV